jgi:[ribosomal protein S5]-alanine N-acetyltransferase
MMAGMDVFDFAAFPSLTTERLLLREIVPDDAPDVLLFRGDPEEQKYNSRPLRDVAEALALIEELREGYAARRWIQWGVTLPPDRRVVGLCGFNYWERHHRRAEIGYDIARPLWGRGIGTEAVAALVRFGFERMALHRIETETIADNHASVRLLEKLGFRLEGLRREYSLEDDGRFHDSAVYGLLHSEYPTVVASLT